MSFQAGRVNQWDRLISETTRSIVERPMEPFRR